MILRLFAGVPGHLPHVHQPVFTVPREAWLLVAVDSFRPKGLLALHLHLNLDLHLLVALNSFRPKGSTLWYEGEDDDG